MKLYHGTNQDFDIIDLSKGLAFKDFGRGFYLTSDKSTAERMGIKKAALFGGSPILQIYEFDESELGLSELIIKRFPVKATTDWIEFIFLNRNLRHVFKKHDYDIVIGPIANDGVVLQLNAYEDGIITAEEAARKLQDRFLDQQYCFCSEKSLQFIKKIESWMIK